MNKPIYCQTKPTIGTKDETQIVILHDYGLFLSLKKFWPCNSRPLTIDEFQLEYTIDEIRSASFSVDPKRKRTVVKRPLTYGDEIFLVSESIEDIENLVGFKLKRDEQVHPNPAQ